MIKTMWLCPFINQSFYLNVGIVWLDKAREIVLQYNSGSEKCSSSSSQGSIIRMKECIREPWSQSIFSLVTWMVEQKFMIKYIWYWKIQAKGWGSGVLGKKLLIQNNWEKLEKLFENRL